eukprot:gene638-9416_t
MMLPARWAQQDSAVAQYLDDTAAEDTGGFPNIEALLRSVAYDGPRLHP